MRDNMVMSQYGKTATATLMRCNEIATNLLDRLRLLVKVMPGLKEGLTEIAGRTMPYTVDVNKPPPE